MKKLLLSTSLVLILAGCGGAEDNKTTGSSSTTTPTTTVSINKPTLEIKEGDGQAQTEKVTFTASRKADKPITVSYKTTDNTAVAGKDYRALVGEVTIPEGATTVDLTLTVIGNTIHQSDREFTLTLVDLKSDAGKLAKGQDVTTIRVKEDDPEPVLTFASVKLTAHETIGEITVPVVADRQSEKETQFRISIAGTATNGSDFSMKSVDFKVPAMSTTLNVPVMILSDSLIEGTEKIDLTLSQVLNGKIGQNSSFAIWIPGDLKLPDTGVTTFYNNGVILSKSPDSAHPYQDAAYGLDTDPSYGPNGDAGFVYTKIDDSGNAVSNNSYSHTCVMDNHTGLTWEVKSNAPPSYEQHPRKKDAFIELMHPHSQNAKYLWNNPDPKTNGGSVGGINKLEFEFADIPGSMNCSFPTKKSALFSAEASLNGCTSDQYVKLVNRSAVCGHKDWRVPSINELLTIASYMPGQLIHDPVYFTDAQTHIWGNPTEIRYLSSTPSSENEASVWCLDVDYKMVMLCNKQTYNSLRLVRGPKL